jgi:two-component system nitrogen regulation response regulator GlnG
MAPAQMIEAKDLPPELLAEASPAAVVAVGSSATAAPPPVQPVAVGEGAAAPSLGAGGRWLDDLEQEARSLLEAGSPEVWDALMHKFEARLIHTALDVTRGRRIEAALKLGIGRNTITRKIQELGLDE